MGKNEFRRGGFHIRQRADASIGPYSIAANYLPPFHKGAFFFAKNF